MLVIHSFTKLLAISLLASTALAGCVSTQGKRIETDQYNSFQEGKTTRSDIVAAMGEPESTNFIGADEMLVYQFKETDNKMMIPVVGIFMGVKIDMQICSFTVGGKNALLKSKSCSANKASSSALGG